MNIGTQYSNYTSLFSALGASYKQTGVSQNSFFPSVSNVYNQSAFGSDALKYVQNIKSASSDLGDALKSLSGGSAFRQQGFVSSDSAAVSLAEKGAKTGQTASDISVERVATTQKNEGTALQAGGSAGMMGYQQFAMEIDGKVHQFSFEALSTDTNKDIQNKMAAAINERGVGVKAEVSTEGGKSTLTVESSKTGQDAAFEIRDVAGSAVQKMGVQGADQNAQDAAYRLDGGELKTSASNTVDVGGGVAATLKKPTDGAVTIKRGTDASGAIDKVKDMVNSYNALYDEALNNVNDSKANNLFENLVGVSRTYTNQLSQLGIGFDQNGYMQIDEERLGESAENGKLEQFFTENSGKNYGFTNQMSRVASDVERNTNRYVSQSSFTGQSSSIDLSSIIGNSTSTLLSSLSSSSGSGSGWMFDFLL